MGAAHPLAISAARPEFVFRCDFDGDGFVSLQEARACYQGSGGAISGPTGQVVPPEAAPAGAQAMAHPGTEAVRPGMRLPPLRFDQLDLAGDGVISRQEWLHWPQGGPAAAAQQQALIACDRDGDGLIDLAEARACDALRLGRLLDAAADPAVGQQQVATAAPGARSEAEYMPMLFDRIDLDGDGAITREEWLRWRDGDATEVAGAAGDTAAAR